MSISPIIATLVSFLIWGAEEYRQESVQIVDVPIVVATEAVEPSELWYVGGYSIGDTTASIEMRNSDNELWVENIDAEFADVMRQYDDIRFIPKIESIESISRFDGSNSDEYKANLKREIFYESVLQVAREKNAAKCSQIFFEVDITLPQDEQLEYEYEKCKELLTEDELKQLALEAEESAEEQLEQRREDSITRYAKLTSLSFYDLNGNPLCTVDSVEDLVLYTQSQAEALENEIKNAKILSGTVAVSELGDNALCKYPCVFQWSIVNDTDDIYVLERMDWDNDDNDWDSFFVRKEYLFAKDLSGENSEYTVGGSGAPGPGREAYRYVRITKVTNIQELLSDLDDDYIKVSSIIDTRRVNHGEGCIYNDTDGDIDIKYTKEGENGAESNTVTLKKGEVRYFDWAYKEFTAIK